MLTGRNNFIALLGVLAMSIPGPSQAATSNTIFGNWRTDDGSAIVSIDKCGQFLCGKIARIIDPKAPANDIHDPDRKKRSQPLVGMMILSKFVGSGTAWKDGRAYDPKTGHSYHSSLHLQDNGTLKVTGCVLFVCRSRDWTRARH